MPKTINTSTENKAAIELSFIIPHKGREAFLIETLESISAQQTQVVFEVILVSQNETPYSSLEKFTDAINLQVIYAQGIKTISESRNLGVGHASGEILAFIDADVKLSEDWVATLVPLLSDSEEIKLVSAMQINGEHPPPLERIRTALSNAEVDQFVNFLPGRNLMLHRATFEQVGGFPAHLVTCEDYYFTDKVAQTGKLLYTSLTTYVHLGEDKALNAMFSKEIWRGQSNLASMDGRKIPLREWPSFVIPIAILMGLFMSLIAAIVCMPISFGLLAITLLPYMAYTLRLKRLVGDQVSVWHCLQFYAVYFPARAIGTIMGVKQNISTKSHG